MIPHGYKDDAPEIGGPVVNVGLGWRVYLPKTHPTANVGHFQTSAKQFFLPD